jgi:phosphodiesterase/alkaline phosphatase D-like protein
VAAAAAIGAAELTHGPILGRVGPGRIGVWVRTDRPATFVVRFGDQANRLDRQSPMGKTALERDNTGWVALEGLVPGARYHYQVSVDGKPHGPKATFRTLRDAVQFRDPRHNPRGLFNFRFEFACGNNQNADHSIGPSLPAFRTMLDRVADDIDFAILNGDWLYENAREYSPDQWRQQVGIGFGETPTTVEIAPTIVGVWQNYKVFLTNGRNLAEWHRRVPSFFTFDDHEILNDVWGAGSAGLRDRRAVFRDVGVQAWYDYLGWSNPVAFTQPIHFGVARLEANRDVLVDPTADFRKLDLTQTVNLHVHWGGPTAGVNDNALDKVGGDPNAGVYEIVEILGTDRLRLRPPARKASTSSYSIGRRSYFRNTVGNCDFFFLDTRSHRELHDVRVPAKPGLSMLGKPQREWLERGMQQSGADFLFVVSSVNFMVPHKGGGAVRAENKDDAWTVFLDERERLIDFFDSLKKPVFVLTGDLHNSFVVRITDRVWEFASGPHNSQNHLASDEGDRPPNGPFVSGPRTCDVRWSTYFLPDVPRKSLQYPTYCVVQVNNVFNNPVVAGRDRWVAFPRPQVIFQYFDGLTGALRYSETVVAEATDRR